MKRSRLLACSFVVACAGTAAGQPGFMCDPKVTHTNGMRIASTEAHRSHNVYWQCDPEHVGYCEGRLSGPLRNDWRSLGTRPWGVYLPPPTPRGPTGNHAVGSAEGLEPETSSKVGELTPPSLGGAALGGARVAPGPAASPLPSPVTSPVSAPLPEEQVGEAGERGWYDSIQSISRKMMSMPEGDATQ